MPGVAAEHDVEAGVEDRERPADAQLLDLQQVRQLADGRLHRTQADQGVELLEQPGEDQRPILGRGGGERGDGGEVARRRARQPGPVDRAEQRGPELVDRVELVAGEHRVDVGCGLPRTPWRAGSSGGS